MLRCARHLVVLMLCMLHGCKTTSLPAVLLEVPFYRQEEGRCGVAALAMALSYRGRAVSLTEIETAVYIPALDGTIPELLAEEAQRHGFAARISSGSIPGLRRWLAAGTVPIIYLRRVAGDTRGHFAVVTGIGPGDREIRVHSGTSSNQWYSSDALAKSWRRGEYSALLITE